MKITIQEIISSRQSLSEFGQKDIPIQASLTIAKNQRILDEVCKEYEDRRLKLVRKYGALNSDSGNITVLPEKQAVWSKEMLKLVMEEINLDLKTVSIDDLGGRKFVVPPNLLVHLHWMIAKPTKRRT